MKSLFFCCLLLQLIYSDVTAQNLFANPGFEAINNCTEYHADCAPEAWFNIPAGNFLVNNRIAPKPLLGNMLQIIPAGSVLQNFNKPRFVFTMLCCPLQKDKKYKLSFYINCTSLANENLFNIFFTDREPSLLSAASLTDTGALTVAKSATTEMPRSNWRFFEYIYTANGNEKFFIFSTNGLPPVEYEMKQAMNKSGDVLYFIDEISMQSIDAIPLCSEYKANTEKLFAYNYRHNNYMPVFKEEKSAMPVVKFISDTVVIPGLLFDVNKSNIKAPVAKILDSLLTVLKQRNVVQVNITGHTDSTGNENNNMLLSEARALAVKNYLIQKSVVAESAITAAGKASQFPVATNTTAAGRQQNRRVQIIITYWLKTG